MVRKNTAADQDMVTARELADRAGVSYDTVDHWAGQGLLTFKRIGRTRLFAAEQNVDRCRRIRELQDVGHNLLTIKGILSGNLR
jgi:excisionase family DNA binding protein